MTPQTSVIEQENQQEPRLQEQQYIRQVEDHSLPAQQVLTDQQERRPPEQPPVLFVP